MNVGDLFKVLDMVLKLIDGRRGRVWYDGTGMMHATLLVVSSELFIPYDDDFSRSLSEIPTRTLPELSEKATKRLCKWAIQHDKKLAEYFRIFATSS